MSISPFSKHSHLINNAFGLQQTVENVCDMNILHKKPILIFKRISQNKKINLEKIKSLVCGSIIQSFFFIRVELGANYHNLIEMLKKVNFL